MSNPYQVSEYKGRPSWLNYSGFFVIGIIIFVVLALVGKTTLGFGCLLFIVLITAILRNRYKYTIEKGLVIMRVGLISRNITELQLRHVRAVNIKQGIFERLLGIGTVTFISAAEGKAATIVFKGIRKPYLMTQKAMRLANTDH